tara:strand:- start:426 stop:803 length:378 start_codon:yes stop_codon:yes gene_type:complete
MNKEISAKQFISLINRKNNNVDFTPIVLFGKTGGGKTAVCELATKEIGRVLDESYTLYFSDIKLQKTKNAIMSEICDRASQGLIQVFSTTNINTAKDLGRMFGLNVYYLDENVGQGARSIQGIQI